MYISLLTVAIPVHYTSELQELLAAAACNARFEVVAAVIKSSGMWRSVLGYFLTILLLGVSVQIPFLVDCSIV
jgi:hypothetical protein